MAQSPFEALVSGLQVGKAIGTDIAETNILKEAYAGADASTMTPLDQQAVYQKAAVLAGQKGLGSVAHIFQKDASELGKSAADQQLSQLKTVQGKLELASQFAGSANNEDDLRKAYQVAGVNTQESQFFESILRNDKIPFAQKKEEFKRMGLTANQDVNAQLKVIQAQLNERKVQIAEQSLLDREKKSASGQSNVKPAKEATQGTIKRQTTSLQEELGDIQVPDSSGNLKPMSTAQLSSVASRIENEGRQRFKKNPGDYSSVQDAVDEARDDIVARDFPTTKTKKTFLGMEVPLTGSEERTYKPSSKETAKPAEKKSQGKKESVTIGGQKYEKPSNWSDAKWAKYKKDMGV